MMSYVPVWFVLLVRLPSVFGLQCPDESWKSYNNESCIRVFTDRKTWNNARLDCQRQGGDLVQIRDAQTNVFVRDAILDHKPGERYFIGVSDQDRDGVYTDVNGESLSYSNWRKRDPRQVSGGRQSCVEMIANKKGRWKNKPCFRRRKYVCEVKELPVNKWDNLRVTWTKEVTPFSFNAMPRTVKDALAYGFKKFSDCDRKAKWRGARYVMDDDYSLVLVYDVNGYIAGMQTTIPQGQETGYPFTNIQPPFVKDGDDAFILTAYFVNPNIICTTGRTESDFDQQGTGTSLYIQSGDNPDTDSVLIPLKESGIAKTEWTKGGCMPTMGNHYWYDTSEDMNCHNFYPVFLLYNKGELNAFGWAMMTNLPSQRLESPPKPTFPIFFNPVPKCLYDQEHLATLHIYLTTNVRENNC